MQKISIIGSGGAGKSTLAKRLGELLDLPVYHLDALYWKPGWVETEKAVWAEKQKELCGENSWIIDGNYGSTMDIRLNASDTIIFLDVNRFVCLFRMVKRTIKHLGRHRPDMGRGCKERFDLDFARWIYHYPNSKKPEIVEKLANLETDTQIHVLKNQRDLNEFISRLEQN